MAQTEADLLDNPVAGYPTLILRSPDFHSITEVVAGRGGWTLAVPEGVTALCADNNWSTANASRACFSRGGAKVLVKP